MALELFVVERLATRGLAAETLAEQRRAWESVRWSRRLAAFPERSRYSVARSRAASFMRRPPKPQPKP